MDTTTHALDVSSFCEKFGISQSFFYKLKRQGKAPRTLKVGSRRIITAEAADEWQRDMEQSQANF